MTNSIAHPQQHIINGNIICFRIWCELSGKQVRKMHTHKMWICSHFTHLFAIYLLAFTRWYIHTSDLMWVKCDSQNVNSFAFYLVQSIKVLRILLSQNRKSFVRISPVGKFTNRISMGYANPNEIANQVLIKPISFTFPFLLIHLGYLRTDISGIDQASSCHLTHISLSFTVISFMPMFMLFDL